MKASLGLGGYCLNPINTQEEIVKYAYENYNIRMFDTSPAYGDSEINIGKALKNYNRNDFILSTKTKASNRGKLALDLFTSLKNLNTEYIDLYFGHSFIDDDITFERSKYVLEKMQEYKKLGTIKSIGVSGHSTTAALKAINSGLVDIIMIPFSIMYQEFSEIIDYAKEKNIKVITMKNFASGILLGGPERKLLNEVSMKDLISFSLCYGDYIIPAVRSKRQLDEIYEAYEAYEKLSLRELSLLNNKFIVNLGKDFCRFCNKCRPCHKYGWAMSQPTILKTLLYQEKLEYDMKEKYEQIKLNYNDCSGCPNDCSKYCPFGINIKSEMKRADTLFKEME